MPKEAKLTPDQAVALVRKHGSITLAASAAGVNRKTMAKWYGRALCQPDSAPEAFAQDTSNGAPGIQLRNARISSTRPSDSPKRLFYGLSKGKGYPLPALMEAWNLSDDTIRKHAKRLDCLRWVETAPGEWTPCVLHPDTAVEYSKGASA